LALPSKPSLSSLMSCAFISTSPSTHSSRSTGSSPRTRVVGRSVM
jgi:hypothetical protein